MPIDIFNDELLSLQDAAAKIARVGGKRLHISTIFRWAMHGVRGQRLETIRIGRQLFTTLPCLQAFFAACAAAPAPNRLRQELKPATRVQREKAIARAEARLAEMGV